MKHRDLQPCCVCRKGVLHDQALIATRVRIARLVVDLNAVKQQTGLEMMIGSPFIAAALGPDRDLLRPLGSDEELLICDTCAMTTTVAELWEKKKITGGGE